MAIKTTTTKPADTKLTISDEKDEAASLIEPVTSMPTENEKLYADLAFLNEEIEVMVGASNEADNSGRLEESSVNGVTQYFLRGQWVKCKRYFLEALLTSKREQWTFGYRYAQDGSVLQTEQGSQGSRFAISVRDMNPKGPAWQQALEQRQI